MHSLIKKLSIFYLLIKIPCKVDKLNNFPLLYIRFVELSSIFHNFVKKFLNFLYDRKNEGWKRQNRRRNTFSFIGVALTLEEERLFKNALKDNRYISAFMLALYTGLRPNELYTAKIEGNFIVAINSKRKNRKLEYKKIPISKMLKPYIANGLIIPNIKY